MARNTLLLGAFVVVVVSALFGSGRSSGNASAAGTGNPSALSSPLIRESRSRRALVPRGDLVVIRRGRLEVMDTSGRSLRRLRRVNVRGAVQGMAISNDRRHLFISIFHGEQSPKLEEVDLATGHRVTLADAISPTVSPADGRLAYVSTAPTQDVLYRTALVVQAGRDPPRQIPLGTPAVVGTPPELVVNWSPDGRRLAIFDQYVVRLVDPAKATSVASQPAVPGRHLLAPAFLSSKRLIALIRCCVGPQRLAVINPTTGRRTRFAVLPAPPINLGRVDNGVLFAVTALQQLTLVKKGEVQIIARHVVAASA